VFVIMLEQYMQTSPTKSKHNLPGVSQMSTTRLIAENGNSIRCL